MTSLILPVPHVQQRNRGECLAACAAMVLGYLDIVIAYGRLLKLLRIRPGLGTPAYNIRELEKLGFIVIYQQGTLAELRSYLANGYPCIAMVKTEELPYWNEAIDHAVVVVGLDGNMVYLNDPAFVKAPISVSQGDFGLAWLNRDEFYATLLPRSR
jgi:ABC-type bacteriocin/lantibiotic exporter with double-glycine peptidase domain